MPPEHTVFQEPPQEKIWYSKVGRPSRPSDVAETTNTDNTLLHVPTYHCDWPYEMASSPLPFLFTPTTTSYRAGAIFKFEMCQSVPRHPVLGAQTNKKSEFTSHYLLIWRHPFRKPIADPGVSSHLSSSNESCRMRRMTQDSCHVCAEAATSLCLL